MAMTKFVTDVMTDSAFSLKLWPSLFLVKLQAFIQNDNARFFDSLFLVSLQAFLINMKTLQ